MEVTMLNNGVIYYDEETRFIGGSTKARNLKAGGVLKMVEQARKVRGI